MTVNENKEDKAAIFMVSYQQAEIINSLKILGMAFQQKKLKISMSNNSPRAGPHP